MQLKGRTALVTGASRGIGRAIADLLSDNDATVVYTDIDSAGADEAAVRSHGAKAMAMDVTDEARVRDVTAEVMREHGHIELAGEYLKRAGNFCHLLDQVVR